MSQRGWNPFAEGRLVEKGLELKVFTLLTDARRKSVIVVKQKKRFLPIIKTKQIDLVATILVEKLIHVSHFKF